VHKQAYHSYTHHHKDNQRDEGPVDQVEHGHVCTECENGALVHTHLVAQLLDIVIFLLELAPDE
jgi:hypothetical protein